jgi:hypothetical protein
VSARASSAMRRWVEGCSSKSGASGDVIEGHLFFIENDCCTCIFDVLSALWEVIRSAPD